MSKRTRKRKQRAVRGSPTWMVSGCIGKTSKDSSDAWRDRGFYSASGSSEVRHIDPKTMKVIESRILEDIATDILKAGNPVGKKVEARVKKAIRQAPISKRPTQAAKDDFYKSRGWRQLRFLVIKEFGRACQCCGATPRMRTTSGDPVRICVDHIKPISKFWNLRLQQSNLQILCDECNQGKGNWDETDFRPVPAADEWVIEDDGIDPLLLAQLDGGRLQ